MLCLGIHIEAIEPKVETERILNAKTKKDLQTNVQLSNFYDKERHINNFFK